MSTAGTQRVPEFPEFRRSLTAGYWWASGWSCAFSLAELLVVLGIIALLISLLFPALSRARAQANYIRCQSNLRQIGQAMVIYANNYSGWMFPPDAGLIVPPSQRWYVSVLKVPTPKDASSTDPKDWTPPLMLCPADDPNPMNYHSYLVNNHLVEHHLIYSSKAPVGITTSRVVVMGEKKTLSTNYYVEILSGNSTYEEQVDLYRHGKTIGSNYLYLDLHVDSNGPTTTAYGADPWDFPYSPTTMQAD
ncbi:MAG TPA: type II secretion system protein [Tepidisphaeraceae bacterium]